MKKSFFMLMLAAAVSACTVARKTDVNFVVDGRTVDVWVVFDSEPYEDPESPDATEVLYYFVSYQGEQARCDGTAQGCMAQFMALKLRVERERIMGGPSDPEPASQTPPPTSDPTPKSNPTTSPTTSPAPTPAPPPVPTPTPTPPPPTGPTDVT